MRGAYSIPIRSFSTAPASTSPAAPGTKGLLDGDLTFAGARFLGIRQVGAGF